ncbi:MAG: DEAD/DEAH box helicase [archaeon]|nr:DEAD/DEAH box helicase [archaeon]
MKFEELDFSPQIKDSIKKMGYENATDVQVDTIPAMVKGNNVIVKSHTGSGKTAAFGIPISDNILNGKSRSALVLCPTRELAVQVKDELRKINSRSGIHVTVFYGGHGMNQEVREIRDGIDILCATPGRLLDHIRNKNLDPRQFDTVVLDEADRMLDMGFIQDLKQILEHVKPKHTHLFSATLDGSVAKLISEYIPTYEEILMKEEIVGKNIFERHIKVPKELKITALEDIITEAHDGRVLVFVSTKRTADFLSRKLYQAGHKVESIHGDKSQRAREFALRNFKTGKVSILVATDVAARGLQIDNVEFVVNYDLANDADTHKHRIGRTGRMGDTGHAISFVGEDGNHIGPRQFFGGGGRGGGARGFSGGRDSGRGGTRGFSRGPPRGGDRRGSFGGRDSRPSRGARGNFGKPRGNRSQRRD